MLERNAGSPLAFEAYCGLAGPMDTWDGGGVSAVYPPRRAGSCSQAVHCASLLEVGAGRREMPSNLCSRSRAKAKEANPHVAKLIQHPEPEHPISGGRHARKS